MISLFIALYECSPTDGEKCYRSGKALEQVTQGSGGVTVSGDVQEIWRCRTEEYDLVGLVVMG